MARLILHYAERAGRAMRARPNTLRALLAGAVLLLAVLAPADLAAQARDTDLTEIFGRKRGEWLANAQNTLLGLFGALLLVELMASSAHWHKEKYGVHQILGAVFMKMGIVTVMVFLFRYPELTTDRLVTSFARLGGAVAGDSRTPMTPTEVVTQGAEIAANLASQLAVERGMPLEPPEEQGAFTRWGAWLSGVYNTLGIGLVNAIFSMAFSGTVVILVCLIIIGSYIVVALQLLLVKIESIIILSTGIVFLPFGAFRLTAGLAEAYLKYVLEVAVRFFFLQLIAGVGYDLFDALYEVGKGLVKYDASRGEMHWVLNPPFIDWQVAVALCLTAVAFAYLSWKIPSLFGKRMTADTRIGLPEAIRGT